MANTQRIFSTHFGPVNSVPKGAVVDPRSTAPLSHSSSFHAKGDSIVRARVVGLLNGCSPSAVLWAIPKVVVDAVNRVGFAWALSHGREKCTKGNPFSTDPNTPSGVVSFPDEIRVRGSGDHIRPNPECSGIGHPVSLASGRGGFILEAPAGNGLASSKVSTVYDLTDSTGTNAVPLGLAIAVISGPTNNRPSTKDLTRKVFEFCHSALLNVAHLMVHGRNRCGLRSGATLAMRGIF